MTGALLVRDLRAGYAGSAVLQGVDLDLAPGEILALLGRNGAGKSTLLHALFGLLRPAAGTVSVFGAAGHATHRLARAGVALVPQGRRIFATLTVAEHLDLADRAGRRRTGPSRADVLALLPRLGERLAQRADRLSGGEQQMLALARALLLRPRLLLLDEPFEGLATTVTARVAALLPELARAGTAVLLVEQHLATATAVADRVAVLVSGRLTYPTVPSDHL